MLPIHQPISAALPKRWAQRLGKTALAAKRLKPGRSLWRVLSGVLLIGMLAGCADLGYLAQSASGHLALMRAAQPVEQWLGRVDAPDALKARLTLAQQIRRFAVTDLGLPDNPSYTRYADLHRSAVVWNVVAAPALSLTLQTWCFPVTGCVGYRGYFDENDAKAKASELKKQGLEVSVYGVPAYSTLGWLNWAGGDPLLNTFINYPDAELARLIFHELAHQVAFAKDDTMFNESFATAVERIGGARWLARQATLPLGAGQAGAPSASDARGVKDAKDANNDAAALVRRSQFRALTLGMRNTLYALYPAGQKANSRDATNTTSAPALEAADQTELLALKHVAYQRFRAQYARLRAEWVASASLTPEAAARQLGGYDAWVANANNASLGAQAAYDELVPEFEALFARTAASVGDVDSAGSTGSASKAWPRFYDEVKRLAQLPEPERRQQLKSKAATASQ